MRACVRPRPSWSGPRWWRGALPTYPEGGSHALQRCASTTISDQVVRVGHFVGLSDHSKNMVHARDCTPADSAETFTVPQRTTRSMVP